MIDDIANLRIKNINLEIQNKEFQKSLNYWRDLVKEMADSMDKNAIKFFKIKDICLKLISEYKNNDCNYKKILVELEKIIMTYNDKTHNEEDIFRIYDVAGKDARILKETKALIQGMRERIDILESENQMLRSQIDNKE